MGQNVFFSSHTYLYQKKSNTKSFIFKDSTLHRIYMRYMIHILTYVNVYNLDILE